MTRFPEEVNCCRHHSRNRSAVVQSMKKIEALFPEPLVIELLQRCLDVVEKRPILLNTMRTTTFVLLKQPNEPEFCYIEA